MPADLDAIATELYSLLPEEFTAARATYEKAAKAAGDKNLAAQVRSLVRPNGTAWLANHLVRQRPDELEALLDLGPALREATATLSGDDLRQLGRQQRQLVNAIVARAKALAAAAGRKVSGDVTRGLEDTLHAALADEGVAQQVRAGCLTTGLQHVGFAGMTGTSPRAATRQPEAGEDTAAAEAAERERQAQLEQARREEFAAQEAVEAATLAQARVAEELEAARATVVFLQVALDTAEAALEGTRTMLTEAAQRVANYQG
jgi:hypothetical protein